MITKTIYDPAYRAMVGRLKKGRVVAHMTQTDIAHDVGRSVNWVSKIEMCELKLCPVMLVRMASACGLQAHQLVRRLEEELSDEDGSPLAIIDLHRMASRAPDLQAQRVQFCKWSPLFRPSHERAIIVSR